MEILIILGFICSLVAAVGVAISFVFKPKSSLTTSDIIKALENEIEKLRQDNAKAILNERENRAELNNFLQLNLKSFNENVYNYLKQMTDILKQSNDKADASLEKIYNQVKYMLESNNDQMTRMNKTVNEKLAETLNERLNSSFVSMNERLDAITKGFGEMQSLSSGVDDLRKVLGNVKTRGVLGETQLNSLLEQMLASNQYIINAQVNKNSQDRVEFAIVLPGKNEKNILLPIDAKFPLEDYSRLVSASDKNLVVEIAAAQKAIEMKIKQEAKKICDKYINPPDTTDFAIMYIPVEGMFAEILRRPGLVEFIQREYKVIISSPSTIAALLLSLQMGFRTLHIEKQSSEMWELINMFKKDFNIFVGSLDNTQKYLDKAGESLGDAARRTQIIQKKINRISGGSKEQLNHNEDDK